MIDVFGKNADIINDVKLWLLDMDGTIYNEDTVFDGVFEFLETIEKNGGKYIFITNNSSKSVEDYVKKLTRLNIKAGYDNFYTSSQATISMLKNKYPNKKVYCQGTKSLIKELKDNNINVTEEVEDDIDLVLVGFDSELSTPKLRNTCEILTTRDLPFYATNPDLGCPVSFGLIPDCGSICQMLYNCTGKKPIYIGKPEPTMINIIRNKLGYKENETAVVGDRIYTDIKAGLNAKVISICVLSGEVTLDDVVNSDVKPTFTFNSVKDLI